MAFDTWLTRARDRQAALAAHHARDRAADQRGDGLERGSRYLFTNTGSDEPMGTSAPLALPYSVMQWLRRHEKFEMEHWTLRRTARTNFSTLTEPHIAEIMLGHRMPRAWQVYEHYDYLPEQATAPIAWHRRLEALTRA